MQVTVSKIVALVIALAVSVPAVASGVEPKAAFGLMAWLGVSLGCIWFPGIIGSYTGFVRYGQYVDMPSPDYLISFMGWVFLCGPLVLVIFF